MPKRKKSPVPHLISDAELDQYNKLSLREKTLKNGDKVVEILYRDPFSGKSRSRSVPENRDALLGAMHEVSSIVSTKRPERIRDPKTPLQAVVEEWFRYAVQNGYERKANGKTERLPYSPATLDNKLTFYNAHIRKRLGNKPVCDITAEMVTLFLESLQTQGVGAHAVQRVDRLLRHDVFPWAKDNGFICVDPTASLKPRTASSAFRKDDYFTVQQVEQLLDVRTLERLGKPDYAKGGYWVDDAPYFRVHLMGLVETGVRMGELAGIRTPDVTFSDEADGSSIRIRRGRLQDYKDRAKEPKTTAGDRTIFISHEFAIVLREHLEHQYDHCNKDEAERLNPNGYVFTTPIGAPINIRAFRKQFKKMCRAAGITNLGTDEQVIAPHPHTTRHTFFTHMKEAGVPQDTFMNVGGQSDPRATMRYMGTTDEARREASEKYRKRLGRDSKNTT